MSSRHDTPTIVFPTSTGDKRRNEFIDVSSTGQVLLVAFLADLEIECFAPPALFVGEHTVENRGA
jgi:hypothetical protein